MCKNVGTLESRLYICIKISYVFNVYLRTICLDDRFMIKRDLVCRVCRKSNVINKLGRSGTNVSYLFGFVNINELWSRVCRNQHTVIRFTVQLHELQSKQN